MIAGESFQSTHLREVRQELVKSIDDTLSFQSTHLREVRPRVDLAIDDYESISIHAPA